MNLERGTGFEPAHPRVEASVHSLFYVTLAKGGCIVEKMGRKSKANFFYF